MPANSIDYLRQAGFKGEALRQAWAIMERESGGRPDAFNGNAGTGDRSYGLFQINMLGSLGPDRMKRYGLSSEKDLLDPATNARVAFQMSKGGTDFGAWAVGPNAYKGAPANAYARYKQYYDKYPGSVTGGQGPATQAATSAATGQTLSRSQPQTGSNSQALLMSLLGNENPLLAGLLNARMSQSQQAKPVAPQAAPAQGQGPSGPGAAPVKGEIVTSKGWTATHVTDGLGWGTKTAGDIMGHPGTPVGAPESGTIVRHGSAQGGDSLYFQGDSGKTYWLGHIANAVPVGTKVKANQPIAVISPDHPRPHLHIDVKGPS